MSKGKSTQTVSLPAYQEAQAKELFQAGKSLAGTPFVPYTGPRAAGFNPDQLRQFQATRGLFESGMQYDPLSGLQELAQKMNEPILKKVQDAIKSVAQANKYDHVFDQSMLMYFNDTYDITPKVLVELLKMEAIEIPQ